MDEMRNYKNLKQFYAYFMYIESMYIDMGCKHTFKLNVNIALDWFWLYSYKSQN